MSNQSVVIAELDVYFYPKDKTIHLNALDEDGNEYVASFTYKRPEPALILAELQRDTGLEMIFNQNTKFNFNF